MHDLTVYLTSDLVAGPNLPLLQLGSILIPKDQSCQQMGMNQSYHT